MPGTFQFSSIFSTDSILSQARATNGPGVGIDDTTLSSLLGASFHFNDDQASITSVALGAGETVSLDVDFGGAGGIDNIDTRMYVIDSFGNVVANVGNSPADVGSTSTQDPKLNFTAASAGVYFIAIVHTSNSYVNGTFGFSGGGTDGGDFTFNAGFAGLAARTFGTLNDDTIFLTNAQKRYDGRDGNDTIYGSTAAATIDGGEGNDYINGGSGRDKLFGGNGDDTVYGNDGNDIVIGGGGTDYLGGGADNDTLYGGSNYDSIFGEAGNDVIFGESGGDYLYDGAGNDQVYGGDDYDYLYSGTGSDTLDGGAGDDSINVYDAAGDVRIDLAISTAQNTGATGLDTIVSIRDASGGNFNDRFFGNGDSNNFQGQNGNDYLDGRAGTDYLYGGVGDDTLIGGTVAEIEYDYLAGGAGKDRLTGGGGGDQFQFNTASDSTALAFDNITDFSHADLDRINLSSVYSGVLVYKDGLPFDGANQVRAVDMGTYQWVYVNLDADLGTNEMVIRVQTADPLLAGDFNL